MFNEETVKGEVSTAWAMFGEHPHPNMAVTEERPEVVVEKEQVTDELQHYYEVEN